MRVVHLLSTSIFSGAENVVCQIIDMYKDNKEIEMFYCSCYGPIEETLNEKKISFIGMNQLSYRELKKIVDEYQPDIIHAHDIKASVFASQFYQKCKIISHIHGNSDKMKRISLKSMLYRFSATKFQHIFWVSKSSFMEYRFRDKVSKISSVLPNIVSMDHIWDKASEAEKNKYDAIFVGRLVDIKNPKRLIHIFSIVVSQLPNAKLAIVGDGDLKDEIHNLLLEKRLMNNIVMLGFQNNPYKFMKNSKLMMMSSKFEGTPMCALEAMSLGLPIISTPTDGLVELIDQNEDGFLSNDDRELANRIVDILTNSNLLSHMSKKAIEKSKLVNNIEKYKEELNKYYFK